MTMDTDIDGDGVDDIGIVRDLRHETNAFDYVVDLEANPLFDMVLLWVAVVFGMSCVSNVVEVAVGSYY